MLDILWVGEFSLENGRAFASDKVDGFVEKTAKIIGFQGDDLKSSVKFPEEKFPIPSDAATLRISAAEQSVQQEFQVKKETILQSAKLMAAVREIFLDDEHDVEYSNTVFEQYVQNIADI